MTNNTILNISSLCKRFDSEFIIDDFSLKLSIGSVLGITGPNGVGKSTLLKLIAGITKPSNGIGTIYEYDIFNGAFEYRRYIQYWSQNPSLYSQLTGRENLNLSIALSSTNFNKNNNNYIEKSSLSTKIDDPVITYSMGMIQKLNLLRFQIIDWDLGLMDEPSSSMDNDGLLELEDSINKWKNNNKTIIISSHDIDFLEKVTSKIIKL